MPYVHYCNTHYNTNPPTDINPLIIQRFKGKKILALCSRESMELRISNLVESDQNYDLVIACGWWELEEVGIFEKGRIDHPELFSYDVIVIIGRHRINKNFVPFLHEIEATLKCSPPLVTR